MTRTHAWAIRLSRHNADALAALRFVKGVEVAEKGEDVWVRGPQCEPAVVRLLRSLPADARFDWPGSERLRSHDSRIPSAQFPGMQWHLLRDWLKVDLPSARNAKPPPPRRVRLRLRRSATEVRCTLLLTELQRWAEYAATAAEVRLSPLKFAVAWEGEALIRGHPLPPLPGLRWVEFDGLGIPAGYTWEPEVHLEVLKQRLGVTPDALVLWREEGTLSRILAEQFLPATRSSVRLSRDAESRLSP